MNAAATTTGNDTAQSLQRVLALQSQHRSVCEELASLLTYEAWLLDNGEYDRWLALMAPELRYVVPVRRRMPKEGLDMDSIDVTRVCHFNDGKMELGFRIGRMRTGFDHYNKPAAFVRRIVGRPLLLHYDETGGAATLTSNFMVFRAREEQEEALLVGARDDIWRRQAEGGWLLSDRLIKLDHYMVPPLSILF